MTEQTKNRNMANVMRTVYDKNGRETGSNIIVSTTMKRMSERVNKPIIGGEIRVEADMGCYTIYRKTAKKPIDEKSKTA